MNTLEDMLQEPNAAYGEGDASSEARDENERMGEDYHLDAKLSIIDLVQSENIAELLDQEQRDEIASKCIENYEADEQAFGDRRDRIQEILKLALMVKQEKNTPWPGAASMKHPLLTETILNFAEMAYPAIVRDELLVNYEPVGDDKGTPQPTGQMGEDGQPQIQMVGAGIKDKLANKLSEVVNYQLTEDIPNFTADLDSLVHIAPACGIAYLKVFYCSIKQRNDIQLIFPGDLVPCSDTRTLAHTQRYTHLVKLYRNEIIERERSKLFLPIEYVGMGNNDTSSESVRDGAITGNPEDTGEQEFLEHYCWLDLDGDRYQEPYIVTLHKGSKKLVRIRARYGFDSIKFRGIGLQYTQDANGGQIPSGVFGDILSIEPDDIIIDFPMIPSFDGSYPSIGYGDILFTTTEAINSMFNMLFDAAAKQNMGGGFIGNRLRMKGGEMRFRPGEWKIVNTSGQAIRDSMMPLPVPEPSNTMKELALTLIDAGRSLGAATKGVAGDMAGNIAPTTALIMADNAVSSFRAIFKRVYRSLTRLFRRLHQLNGEYFDPLRYEGMFLEPVTREDFKSKAVKVRPIADPEVVTRMQEMAKSSFLMQFKDDPLIDQIKLRERVLKAARIEDIEELVAEPQPQAPDPMIQINLALAQAQVALTEAQIQQITASIARDEVKMRQDVEKNQAEITAKYASAAKSIADAEAAEVGTQIDSYIATTKTLGDTGNGEPREQPAA